MTHRLLIEAMAKHLPPSASTLKLLDVSGVGAILSEGRADLQVIDTAIDEDSVDAVVAFDRVVDPAFLSMVLRLLRPGGRLIAVMPEGEVSEKHGHVLEDAGYHRILVEAVSSGVLMRGEKPHISDNTLERVRVAADADSGNLDMQTYRGRYVYLLIKQTPNKPVWAMRSDEAIHWEAVSVGAVLLGFTSLPKAVSFMQPAVLSGWIQGVNKVSKFKRETIAGWSTRILLNPALDRLAGVDVAFNVVDPQMAEAPDE